MNAAPSLPRLHDAAVEVTRALAETGAKIALAESCTGGLVTGLLAGIPGMSKYLCGTFVVYSNESKKDWLGVPPQVLDEKGAVSKETAEKMALGALERAKDAEISLSITGHLGPDAPQELDGVVWVAWAHRAPKGAVTGSSFFRLGEFPGLSSDGRRLSRQLEASEKVLHLLADRLNSI
jgi:PncC family amidohydrolase